MERNLSASRRLPAASAGRDATAPRQAGCLYVFSARTGLPLPVRNERGEGRREGHPTADTPTQLQARPPSSPHPSPPSAGGEGEETGALNTYGCLPPRRQGLAPSEGSLPLPTSGSIIP